MKKLIVSVPAKADLRGIWNYFSNVDEKKAIQIADNLQQRFADLLSFPGMGRSRSEISQQYRSFVTGSYVIYYEEREDGIEILRVLHGAQDIRAAFSDDPEEIP